MHSFGMQNFILGMQNLFLGMQIFFLGCVFFLIKACKIFFQTCGKLSPFDLMNHTQQQRRKVGLTFYELQKAFDTVNKQILIENGVVVPNVNSFKYLGVYLDRNLNYIGHIERKIAPIVTVFRKVGYVVPLLIFTLFLIVI
jgi:hypothetical protein